jgi:hypothetical protein
MLQPREAILTFRNILALAAQRVRILNAKSFSLALIN